MGIHIPHKTIFILTGPWLSNNTTRTVPHFDSSYRERVRTYVARARVYIRM